MKSKEEFEIWYSKEDPWRYNNTLTDKVRRLILIRHLNELVDTKKEISILDVGCGEGYVTKDVANYFNAQIDAFDISDKAIEYAGRNNNHPRINYFQSDLVDFHERKKYDLIICEEALYYLDDEERNTAMHKFNDLLNKHGLLKISVVIVGSNKYGRYFTIDSITELLNKSGFQIYSIRPSVLNSSNFISKALFRIFASIYKKHRFAFFVKSQTVLTSIKPLINCYQISILSKKAN